MRWLAIALLCVPSAFGAQGAAEGSLCVVSQEGLDAAETQEVDQFGSVVAVDGDRAIVTAPRHDPGGVLLAGAAYVFARDGTRWVEETQLLATPPVFNTRFGESADLEGRVVVVGAPRADTAAMNAGEVYVFRLVGVIWTMEQRLLPAQVPDLFFGSAVALEGNFLAIGAPGYESGGAVFVYEREASGWKRQAILPGEPASEGTGSTIAFNGETIAVRVARTIDNRSRIRIFQRVGSQWVLDAVLDNPTPHPLDAFGMGLGLSGDTVLVGTPRLFGSTGQPGGVHVFTRMLGFWFPTDFLQPGDSAKRYLFGSSLAFDGRTAIIGAPGLREEEGAAFVFTRDGFDWTEHVEVLSPRAGDPGEFGSATALSADAVVVGAPRASPKGLLSGLAAAFVLRPAPQIYCAAKPNSLGCVPSLWFTGAPSASASEGFEVEARDVRNQKPGLLLYGVSGRTHLPFQGGTLCVAAPLARSVTVSSGGNPPPFNDCSGVLRFDMNAFAAGALGGNPLPELRQSGATVNAQWWGRDAGASFNSMLSDAIEFVVCQ